MTQKSGEKRATEGREEVPERWSTQRKMEVVLRLLRGEDLGEVSREIAPGLFWLHIPIEIDKFYY